MIDKFIRLPNDVKKSIADQLKLLAWAFGGINTYFRHVLGNTWGIILVITTWFTLQFLAHYLLAKIKNNEGKENK